MDSIFSDTRIWITLAITVITALISIITRRLFKDHDLLFEKYRELDTETDNLHSIITGHMQYHQGLDNSKKES
jgi:hypothetical protein